MKTFEQTVISEDIKRFGKMKMYKRKDPLNSHKYKMGRGLNRKTLRQVPKSQEDGVKGPKISSTIASFVKQLDVSNKLVDVAKKAPTGVWRISKAQVLDVAKKYKFNVPDTEKPMKHLGSTGIQMVRFKPGVFYLYKPHRKTRKTRMRTAAGRKTGHFQMGMGIVKTFKQFFQINERVTFLEINNDLEYLDSIGIFDILWEHKEDILNKNLSKQKVKNSMHNLHQLKYPNPQIVIHTSEEWNIHWRVKSTGFGELVKHSDKIISLAIIKKGIWWSILDLKKDKFKAEASNASNFIFITILPLLTQSNDKFTFKDILKRVLLHEVSHTKQKLTKNILLRSPKTKKKYINYIKKGIADPIRFRNLHDINPMEYESILNELIYVFLTNFTSNDILIALKTNKLFNLLNILPTKIDKTTQQKLKHWLQDKRLYRLLVKHLYNTIKEDN